MLISAGELITQSWKDYRDRWHDWTILSLMVFLPTFILMVAGSFGIFLNSNVPSTIVTTNIVILVLSLAALIFAFWTSLAIIHATGSYIKEGRIDYWKDHFAATIPNIWTGIYISIIIGIVIFFGVLFFLIPGIIFFFWYYFALYEIVLGGKKGLGVMRASRDLLRGRWWATFWRIIAPALVFLAAFLVAQYIILTIVYSFPLSSDSSLLLENVVNTILTALIAPLTTLALARLYLSLKENPLKAETK